MLSALTRAFLHTWLQDFIKVPPMAILGVKELGVVRVYKSVVVTPFASLCVLYTLCHLPSRWCCKYNVCVILC